MKTITFVTGNKHKVRETEQILKIQLAIADIDLDEIQELDLQKVALHKLDQAYQKLHKPVMIDDVSVVIHAWNNFPGPLIKWVLHAGGNSSQMLLKMMEAEKERGATATLAIGFADGVKRELFIGEVTGEISYKEEGANGFGWDKVFIPKGYTQTLASLDPREKNAISHRGNALRKFDKFIHSYYTVI